MHPQKPPVHIPPPDRSHGDPGVPHSFDSTHVSLYSSAVGAASGEIDLLPVPSPTANWTARLSVHYSQDSSLIYWFNGSQAAQVPMVNGVGAHEGLSDHFTLSLWMKHAVTPGKGKKEEETVICSTVRSGEIYPWGQITFLCG